MSLEYLGWHELKSGGTAILWHAATKTLLASEDVGQSIRLTFLNLPDRRDDVTRVVPKRLLLTVLEHIAQRRSRAVPYWTLAGSSCTKHPRLIRKVYLYLTTRCNLACSYCYVSQQTGVASDMSAEIATQSLSDIFQHACPERGRIDIHFFGGEPLLAYNRLKWVVEWVKSRFPDRELGFAMSTNGLLLSKEYASFLRHHRFCIKASLDGSAPGHHWKLLEGDRRRYHGTVVANLKDTGLIGYQRLWVGVTVTARNADPKILDELLGCGFKRISLQVVACPGESEMLPTFAAVRALLERAFAIAKDHIGSGRAPPFEFYLRGILLLCASDRSQCGAGMTGIAVAPDGKYLLCHRFIGDSRGEIGQVGLGVNARRVSALFQMLEEHAATVCGDCWCRGMCFAGCYYQNLLCEGSLAAPYRLRCQINRVVFTHSASLLLLAQQRGVLDNLLSQGLYA